MADDKKTEPQPEKKAFEATAQLRWFHPAGQIQTARKLQQLWTAGEDEDWRDVPVFEEGAPVDEPVIEAAKEQD